MTFFYKFAPFLDLPVAIKKGRRLKAENIRERQRRFPGRRRALGAGAEREQLYPTISDVQQARVDPDFYRTAVSHRSD